MEDNKILEDSINQLAESLAELSARVEVLEGNESAKTIVRPAPEKPKKVENAVTIKGKKYLIKLAAWKWGGTRYLAEEVAKDKALLEAQLQENPSVFEAVSKK